MYIAETTLIAIALSMDALAVSVAGAACAPKLPKRNALAIAGSFGFFQMIMPIIGWESGEIGCDKISAYGNLAAFAILLAIGGKMIFDSFRRESADASFVYPLCVKALLALAVATSIDAFAVGVSFRCLGRPILLPSAYIGLITFAISTAGLKFGAKIGGGDSRFALAGGLILVGIGVKILAGA